MTLPINQVIHSDCFDVMQQLPSGSIDAIITDPPYMTTDLEFDKIGFDLKKFILESIRITKDNGYLAVFAPVEMQAEFAKYWNLRYSGAWVKSKGGMRTHSAKKPRNQWELYCVFAHPSHKISNLTWNKVFTKGKPYKKVQSNNGYQRDGRDQLARANTSAWTKEGYVSKNDGTRQQTDVIYGKEKGCMPHWERTPHPTQKPINVMSTLVQWLTNENDIILDPFSGSGSTGIACKNLNRRYILVEKELKYFHLSQQRLGQEIEIEEECDIAETLPKQPFQSPLF